MLMRSWHSMRKFDVFLLFVFFIVLLTSTKCYADYKIKSDDVRVDASAFDKNLSTDDDTVQKALDKLDDMTATPLVDQYVLTDYDAVSAPMYFGFLKEDGAWFIQQVDSSASTVLYSIGASGYATAWAGRAGLTYDTYDNVFGGE